MTLDLDNDDRPEGFTAAAAAAENDEAPYVYKQYNEHQKALRDKARANVKMPKWDRPEDFVVSGIAGRFPESDSVKEFETNLYNNVDLVVEDERRWPYGYLGLPKGSGKLRDISLFDNKFFLVNDHDANYLDAQVRIMLEITFEALWDAGIDPETLGGTNTGFFIGNSFDEFQSAYGDDCVNMPNYRQCFFAYLSNVFDWRGPSKLFDTACASGFSALHEAMVSLRSGQCDRAIVLGVNLCLRAIIQNQFLNLNMISPDGHCKCLDDDANGYAKGEACVAIVLQPKAEAKRIYATVVHTKTNIDGFKELGITFPSFELQRELIQDTYTELGMNPHEVGYCEAHCTGTKAGDPSEMRAIYESMCVDRKEPLLIGAIKSVIGHTEAASGLCSLVKSILSFENELIPANLHMTKINHQIEGLVTGMLKPVTENTPYKGKYIGLNCFGFGGVNVHVVIQKHVAAKEAAPAAEESYPRLITFCGRNKQTLDNIHSLLMTNPVSLQPDFLALLNDTSKTSPYPGRMVKGMRHRGYVIFDRQSGTLSPLKFNKVKPKTAAPVCFVFTGMGCQWPAMGEGLYRLEVVANTLDRCQRTLKAIDGQFDLRKLLTDKQPELLQSTLNSFVAIAAVQMALVDLLAWLGIEPDHIVGHSIGELTCAYADGCLTVEECITAAYWRGKLCEQELAGKGAMAAIGGSWVEADEMIKKYGDDRVWLACNNSSDSVTVAGDKDSVEAFLANLQQHQPSTFARVVSSTGAAFHTPDVEKLRPALLQKLATIDMRHKQKTTRWISTTYDDESDEVAAEFSAEYLVDNLIKPVRFYQAMKKVPSGAVVVEIAPHNLLQSIIKRIQSELADDNAGGNMFVATMSRQTEGADGNIKSVLRCVGELYHCGYNPKVELLYPKVQYPVARGTPSLHSLIAWKHDRHFVVTQYPDFFNQEKCFGYRIFDLQHKQDKFIADHCIDGRILFPATAYLQLAWQALAQAHQTDFTKLPVIFENVTLHRATIMPKMGEISFDVRYMKGGAHFVIMESGTITTTGLVRVPENAANFLRHQGVLDAVQEFEGKECHLELKNKDIYKEFRLRGYDYGPEFQVVEHLRVIGDKACATVNFKNWVTFLDGMIQMAVIGRPIRGLYLPVRLNTFRIDPRQIELDESAAAGEEAQPKSIDVVFDSQLNIGVARGIEYHGVKANLAPRKVNNQVPVEELFEFVPHTELDLPYFTSRATSLSKAEELTRKLHSYQEECAQLYRTGAASSDDVNRHEKNAEAVLYNLLWKIKKNELELSEKTLEAVEDDLLFQTYLNERFLRSQLELACENTVQAGLNILEVNQTGLILAPKILNLLLLSSVKVNFNYRLLHSAIDKLSASKLEMIQSHDTWQAQKSKFPSDMANQDLIVYKDSSLAPLAGGSKINFELLLESIWGALGDTGFALILLRDKLHAIEELLLAAIDKEVVSNESRLSELFTALNKTKLKIVGHKSDRLGVSCVLVRKVSTEMLPQDQTIYKISNNTAEWFEKLQTRLREIETEPANKNVWLVANQATSGVVGFISCLHKEPMGGRVRCILNADKNIELEADSEQVANIIQLNLYTNVINEKGQLGSYKHFTLPDNEIELVPSEHCYLNVVTRGDLSSLRWFEAQHKFWPLNKQEGQVLCQIYYAPLNFRDIMLATGKLPPDALPDDMGLDDCILGLEFSGRDENGRRVMGMVPAKGLATTVVMNHTNFLWPIPDAWTMEEAATIPVAYSTAYYSLIIRGKLHRGEKVLIHSGSGAVGQAAIAICLDYDCPLYITVGSEEKRELLMKRFPQLKPSQFASSRNIEFERFIMQETNGRGVDIVLNSLAEEKLQASVNCLAPYGRFLEIGKYDLSQNNLMNIAKIMENKTFHGILLDNLFNFNKSVPNVVNRHREKIWELMQEGMKRGVVRPLDRTIFSVDECEQAFRFMASGKHTGKVIVCIRPEETAKLPAKGSFKMNAIPRSTFLAHKSYIITGGLGGFGLELINWMVEREARNFVVTSRSGVKDLYQKARLKHFESKGAKVVIFTEDTSNEAGAAKLVEAAESLGPLGGVFHLAMLLRDGLFDNQTLESFEAAIKPKADVFFHLDVITRQRCPTIDYFVAFSSVSCGVGNPGQTNYGFANSVMERICEQRRKDNLHGFAIQWGAIGDVGYIIDNIRGNDVVICGSLPQRIPSCLAALDRLLQEKHAVCSNLIKADFKFDVTCGKTSLIKTVAHILGLKDYENLDLALTLGELGMDSLMGVEVKQAIERDFDVVLSMQDIRKLTIGKIVEIGSGKMKEKVDGQGDEAAKAEDSIDAQLVPLQPVVYLNDIVNGEPILFLPQIDASWDLLRPLAAKLNRPAIGINWTKECKDLKTVAEVAHHYIAVLDENMPNLESSYDLVGYSFGGIVAIEMGIQLQKRKAGRTKRYRKLIMLDSSPKQFKLFTDEAVKRYNISELNDQAYVESMLMFLMEKLPIDYNKVKEALLALEDTAKRLEAVRDLFRQLGNVDIQTETLEILIHSHYNKMVMINQYECAGKSYEGDLMLLRADESIIKDFGPIKEDYWLDEIITGHCLVHILKGDHQKFLSDNGTQLAQHIHSYLEH